MTPKPPARRAKKGRAKPVKMNPVKAHVDSVCGVGFGSQHSLLLTAHAIGETLFALENKQVWLVPDDGSYIVKRKEARRGK